MVDTGERHPVYGSRPDRRWIGGADAGSGCLRPDAGQPLSLIVSLALLLPNLAVSVRRLHDTDRSGWWLLLSFIPIFGTLALLYFMVLRGTEGSNRFG